MFTNVVVSEINQIPCLLIALLSPIFAALAISIYTLTGRRLSRNVCGIISTGSLIISTAFIVIVAVKLLRTGRPVLETYPFTIIDVTGVFGLYADGISLIMGILITFLSAAATLYSVSYMATLEFFLNRETESYQIFSRFARSFQIGLEHPEYVPERKPHVVPAVEFFFVNLLLFAACMLGMVISTNLVFFVIFYEFVAIPTFLIVYVWGSGPCRLIGIKYFMYMGTSGVLVLIGIAAIWAVTGSLSLFDVPTLVQKAGIETAILIAAILFVGFGIKAAIWPFHSWLPDTHAQSPAQIASLLSGAYTKCGIYGIIRFVFPCLAVIGSSAITIILAIGLITMYWGAITSMIQRDVKRLLAFSTMNQLGYIIFGFGSGTFIGILGALFHIVAHGVSKAMLMLLAGSLIHATHNRDLNKYSGLAPTMPVTATCTIIGALSIAGVPPLAGFISEWMIFTGVTQAGYLTIAVLGFLSTVLTMGYYLWVIRRAFFHSIPDMLKNVRESPLPIIIPIAIECFFVILIGIYPQLVIQFLAPIATSLHDMLQV